MRVLVLSLLVAVATASPLLGSDRCTWGPSYWCSHIKAAKECNAVQHCISTVWKNQKLPAVTDENCDVCKLAFQEIDTALENNATQKQVLAYLEQACSIIPDSGLAAQCKSMVDEFFPEIMQLIIAKLDPKTICTALGFCTQGFKPKSEAKVQGQKPLDNILGHVQLIKTQSKAPVKVGPSEGCDVCKLIMTAARAEIKNNKTEQEIEAFIEKYLCGNVGSMKDECDKLVAQYGPIIFNFLAQEMDPETLCRAIGLCTSMKKPLMSLLKEKNEVQSMSQVPMQMISPAAKKVTARASTQCVVCEFLISKLESELKDNATEQEIINAVEKVCTLLPKTVQTECQNLIQRYGYAIITLLVNEVKPKEICTILGLCSATQRVPKYVFGNEACVMCETMAMYLQALLKEKDTEIAIRQELERVCNFLPDTEAAICDGLLVMYGEKIVLALANKISAKDICQFIDLCPKSKSYQTPKLVKELQVDVKSIEFCPICEMVVTKIDEFLKENSTEAMIVEALDKVCSFMPATVKAECDGFVKQYGPMVVQLLAQQIDPKVVCTKLGLCTATQAKKVAVEKLESAVSCEVCQLAAGYLDALLEKNSTEAEIKTALNQLCGYLPSSVKSECDALVNEYGDMIIKLLAQELSPSVICKELGLCTSQKAPVKKVQSATTCEFCTLAVGYLDALLEKNSTEAQIEAALNQLCGYLPSSVKSECNALVKQYGPMIIKLLAQELSPSVICKALGLCTSQKATAKPHLLGAEKCTWGPSYWCANFDNANKCNAVEHCNKHVWKNEI